MGVLGYHEDSMVSFDQVEWSFMWFYGDGNMARIDGNNLGISLADWWYTYPSEKYEFVSWDDEIPN